MTTPAITPDVAKLADDVYMICAEHSQPTLLRDMENHRITCMKSLHLRLATALQEAFNAGVEASAKVADVSSGTTWNVPLIIRKLKIPDGAK